MAAIMSSKETDGPVRVTRASRSPVTSRSRVAFPGGGTTVLRCVSLAYQHPQPGDELPMGRTNGAIAGNRRAVPSRAPPQLYISEGSNWGSGPPGSTLKTTNVSMSRLPQLPVAMVERGPRERTWRPFDKTRPGARAGTAPVVEAAQVRHLQLER